MFMNFYCYVCFLLLRMFCSVYSVSFCFSVYCFFVNVYCTTAAGCQPNCSKQIYHTIISYIISYHISYLPEPSRYCRYTSIVAKYSFN